MSVKKSRDDVLLLLYSPFVYFSQTSFHIILYILSIMRIIGNSPCLLPIHHSHIISHSPWPYFSQAHGPFTSLFLLTSIPLGGRTSLPCHSLRFLEATKKQLIGLKFKKRWRFFANNCSNLAFGLFGLSKNIQQLRRNPLKNALRIYEINVPQFHACARVFMDIPVPGAK